MTRKQTWNNAPLLHCRIIEHSIELRRHHRDSTEVMSSSGTPEGKIMRRPGGDAEKSIGIWEGRQPRQGSMNNTVVAAADRWQDIPEADRDSAVQTSISFLNAL